MTQHEIDLREQAINHSQRAVNEIDELLDYEPFQRFLERGRIEADQMADRVLHADMTLEEREKLRIRRLGWLDVLLKAEQDRATHISILEQQGISLVPRVEEQE